MIVIDLVKLRDDLYEAVFEKDTPLQKWDSGCWIRYKLVDQVLNEQPVYNIPVGTWDKKAPSVYSCSKCEFRMITPNIRDYKFCPGCGHKMEVENE